MNREFTLVDTHAHLDFEELNHDIEGVINRANDAGVKYIITVGGGKGVESNQKAVSIAREYRNVYASVGLHPDGADKFNGDTGAIISRLGNNPRVVAIGETGLDLKCHVPVVAQKECFEFQIELAKKLHLPLIIHSREAHDDVIDILRQNHGELHSGVFHCFSGTREVAKKVLDLGFFVSFTGIVTFRNARGLPEVVKFVPVERILVETDAPFLSPEPFRGRTNEPSRTVYIAQKIAELKGLSFNDVARITSYNARKLFGIGDDLIKGAIAYSIRDSLYLNITNRCTNSCVFCPKTKGSYYVKGYDLRIEAEPSADEVISAAGDLTRYREVVFCGYGEPLLRLDIVKEVASYVKSKGVRVRIDTDGLANLVHGRNILPELAGIVDAISVSLNAPDPETYRKLCPSRFGDDAFQHVVDFIREAKKYIPDVTASVVSLPGLDIESCRRIAEELNVKFRVREFNNLG